MAKKLSNGLKLVLLLVLFIFLTSIGDKNKKAGFGCSSSTTSTSCTVDIWKSETFTIIKDDTCNSLGSMYACYINGKNPTQYDGQITEDYVTLSGVCVKVTNPIFT